MEAAGCRRHSKESVRIAGSRGFSALNLRIVRVPATMEKTCLPCAFCQVFRRYGDVAAGTAIFRAIGGPDR
jgi:hypothetical protein